MNSMVKLLLTVLLILLAVAAVWRVTIMLIREPAITFNESDDVLRNPLIGRFASFSSWAVVVGIFFFSALGAFVLFARCRKRIAFY